jgi:hypothetical protein
MRGFFVAASVRPVASGKRLSSPCEEDFNIAATAPRAAFALPFREKRCINYQR